MSQQRIARELGVSQALVSLVLNGKRQNISEESYQRIWDHAVKIGYRPKGMQLVGNRVPSTSVGFILRAGVRLHTQSNFFSHVQHGLHEGLLERGYHSMFLGSEDDLGVRKVQEKLRQHQLFGLAILGQVDEKFLHAIKAEQPNVVLISATFPGVCHSVMPNEKQAIEQLVEHLISLGHRQFGWIGGDKGLDYNLRRRTGLTEILQRHGLKLNPKFAVDVDAGDRLAGWNAAEIMLGQISRKSHPTAWVCGNGLMARGTLNCLMQSGWQIPEELSVVAIDATRVCAEEHPQITGAHSDPEKIGRTAAELLLKAADVTKEGLMDVLLPSQLSVRETSDKVPAQ